MQSLLLGKPRHKKGDNVILGGGVTPLYLFLAQIYQGLKSLENGLCTLTNSEMRQWLAFNKLTTKCDICLHTCK